MIKKITCFMITVLMCLTLTVSSCALYYGESLPRVIDGADLLAGTEEMQLLAKFDEIADTQDFDVIVATVNTLEGKSPQEYADDLYDYNDFGLGDKKDGILLLVSMEDRDVYISTTGYGTEVFPDGEWENILNQILPYLSDARYYEAFEKYTWLCQNYLKNHSSGINDGEYGYGDWYYDSYYSDENYNSYDDFYTPFEDMEFDFIKWIPISLVIGMTISLLIMLVFRSKLKSVRRKPTAHDYQVPGSMQVTHQSDMYLYSHVTKTPRQTQQNNNHPRSGGGFSGGGVHVGSSGRSHGGGGGKF